MRKESHWCCDGLRSHGIAADSEYNTQVKPSKWKSEGVRCVGGQIGAVVSLDVKSREVLALIDEYKSAVT